MSAETGTLKIVVGLGNPGNRYTGTRHNLGYALVDSLAKSPNACRFQERFKGMVAELRQEPFKVLLVKPMTFMNLSGQCVRQFVDFYQTPLTDLMVVCDDINLPLGKLRVRTRGTHGGHNGLRDIQAHLGTPVYPRLRIGVDAPGHDAIEHVLGRFRPSEQAVIEDAVGLAAQAVGVWIHQGIEACMNQYNAGSEKKKD
jgi:PTH1 family peptidyl-tRNA hydrolase